MDRRITSCRVSITIARLTIMIMRLLVMSAMPGAEGENRVWSLPRLGRWLLAEVWLAVH